MHFLEVTMALTYLYYDYKLGVDKIKLWFLLKNMQQE